MSEVTAATSSPPLQLLDLPMEMQLLIYKYALTSSNGTLILSTYKRNNETCKIFEGLPQNNAAVAMLATCSHIYAAAQKLLYTSNTFFIQGGWQRFPHHQFTIHVPLNIPEHVLPWIQDVFLLVNVEKVDLTRWKARGRNISVSVSGLQSMSGLENLRVAIMAQRRWAVPNPVWTKLAGVFIEEAPKGCDVVFGTGKGEAELEFVKRYWRLPRWDKTDAVEVCGEELQRRAEKHRHGERDLFEDAA